MTKSTRMRVGILLVVSCNRGPSRAVSEQPPLRPPPARSPASADAMVAAKPSNSEEAVSSVVKPAALYAGLFEQGKRWSFAAEVKRQSPSTDGQNKSIEEKERGTLACEVKHVERLVQALVAHVECDGPSIPTHPDNPAGTYVATADGLWRVEQAPRAPEDLAKLSPSDRLLARSPRAGERHAPADSSGCEQWRKTRVFKDGFCVTEGTACGDDGDFTLCFSQSRGLIGGSAFLGGGSVYDLRYGSAPRDP